jgi:hypothetical protein
VAAQHSFDVIFAPGLNGPEIARWRLPSVNEHNVIHLPARPNPVRGR